MNTKFNYRVGSKVRYRSFDGTVRTVTVESKADDIKDGRPGFDGQVRPGEWAWGYDDQILAVVEF